MRSVISSSGLRLVPVNRDETPNVEDEDEKEEEDDDEEEEEEEAEPEEDDEGEKEVDGFKLLEGDDWNPLLLLLPLVIELDVPFVPIKPVDVPEPVLDVPAVGVGRNGRPLPVNSGNGNGGNNPNPPGPPPPPFGRRLSKAL